MTLSEDVNFEELARSTDEFNAAQLKATCVEAGMMALREGASKLTHEHFLTGIAEGELDLIEQCRLWLLICRFQCKVRRRTISCTLLDLIPLYLHMFLRPVRFSIRIPIVAGFSY